MSLYFFRPLEKNVFIFYLFFIFIIFNLYIFSMSSVENRNRIEKGPVQTVAIKLDSLEYHYMLKH